MVIMKSFNHGSKPAHRDTYFSWPGYVTITPNRQPFTHPKTPAFTNGGFKFTNGVNNIPIKACMFFLIVIFDS